MTQGERPSWQTDAEQLGIQLRRDILNDMQSGYSGSARFFIHSRFGEDVLKAVLLIAEDNLRLNPAGDFAKLAEEASLLYAINRLAFDKITTDQGYRRVAGQPEALGIESIAVLTRSGSMVFAGPGSLTATGEIGYLPIAGRVMQPVFGNGLIIPTQSDVLLGGYIPVPGQRLKIRGVSGLGMTSSLVEVKMKYGDGETYRDSMESMMGTMMGTMIGR